MGVQKFSHCFLGSKLLANKLSLAGLFEFTVIRKHSGSVHMVSLGFVSMDSMPILSYMCQPSRGGTDQNVCFASMLDKYDRLLTKTGCLPSMCTTIHCTCKAENRVKVCSYLEYMGNKKKYTIELTLYSGNLHFLLSWKDKGTYCYLLKKKKRENQNFFSGDSNMRFVFIFRKTFMEITLILVGCAVFYTTVRKNDYI